MIRKSDNHIFGGLQRDLAVSKQKPEFLWDALNIRLTARDGDTFLSVTNEKGTLQATMITGGDSSHEVQDFSFEGDYLGHCVLGKYLIVFTASDWNSFIYKIEKLDDCTFRLHGNEGIIVRGQLGFRKDHPIESIGVYENLNIQKVYWVDGYNPVRFINIVDPKYDEEFDVDTKDYFDFTRSLQLREEVSITKIFGEGSFPAGVVQYHITYYNKYGQESRIAYSSELVYSAFSDRGGSPEDTIANSFKITIDNVDKNFDFLRLYCTIRTSKEAQVTARIVKDFDLTSLENDNNTVVIVDNGLIGSSFDPAALLYVGGEELVASTIVSKDNTLFLGDIHLPDVSSDFDLPRLTVVPQSAYKDIPYEGILYQGNIYDNLLDSYSAGFKGGELYRLGIQFQDNKGKWSEPIFIGDYVQEKYPEEALLSSKLKIPIFKSEQVVFLGDTNKYKKVRGIVSFPSAYNRRIIAQGLLSPTVYNSIEEEVVQSSWFFRPNTDGSEVTAVTSEQENLSGDSDYTYDFAKHRNNISVEGGSLVQYVHGMPLFTLLTGDRGNEIQGMSAENGDPSLDTPLDYRVNQNIVTFHSPDIEFTSDVANLDWNEGFGISLVGNTSPIKTYGDIDIQTSSPTISSRGSGFEHHTTFNYGWKKLVSGLFYSDYLVEFDDNKYRYASDELYPMLFMVSPWQKSGSLNNDIVRPTDGGTRSAVLKRKIISNLSIMTSSFWEKEDRISLDNVGCALFNSDQVTLVKLGDTLYYGNVDTMLIPKLDSNKVPVLNFPVSADKVFSNGEDSNFFSSETPSWKDTNLWHLAENSSEQEGGVAVYDDGRTTASFGTPELRYTKESIRMKYKSTPHAVIDLGSGNSGKRILIKGEADERDHYTPLTEATGLILAELTRGDINYNGYEDVKDSVWVPAGKAVTLQEAAHDGLTWEWGDTWYQRYDCLKTYAFTNEDENSIVEIGSFICETKVNLGGRYDRNKGQKSNLYMSPINFNLINPVYSQLNNFFTYRKLDEDYYKLNDFSNSVIWSKEKLPASTIDSWTSILSVNMLNMEGKCGKVNSLQTINDSLYCFQETGISQILFNSRVQIPVSDGVPIEISNGYKVDGYRYISDSTGVSNKHVICKSKSGIYFIDSVSKDLYNIGSEGFTNVSATHGFSFWFDSHEELNVPWTPDNYTARLFYDKSNQDLYIVTKDTCLVFSEILGQFTSFMSYENIPAMFNIEGNFYACDSVHNSIWCMFKGKYCHLFGYNRPFHLTYVSNADSTFDKIFTNIELRADFYDEQDNSINMFDYIQVWNEYQDTGKVLLNYRNAKPSNAKKKFRIWRLNIPNDKTNKMDRIRNTWCFVKLGNEIHEDGRRMVLHDLSTQYYI